MNTRFQSIAGPANTGQLLQVRMTTGKHAGKIVLILDIPHVVTWKQGSNSVTILLPGLEGDGVALGHPDKPQEN